MMVKWAWEWLIFRSSFFFFLVHYFRRIGEAVMSHWMHVTNTDIWRGRHRVWGDVSFCESEFSERIIPALELGSDDDAIFIWPRIFLFHSPWSNDPAEQCSEVWQQHISSHVVVNLLTKWLTSFMFYGLTKWHIFATIIIWLLDIDIPFFSLCIWAECKMMQTMSLKTSYLWGSWSSISSVLINCGCSCL